MRRSSFAILAAALALAGCGGGGTNNTASANNAAPAKGSSQADADRTAAASLCERQMTGMPSAPPGFNPRQVCNCAVDKALAGQSDPRTYVRSPEGQQALMQAMMSCVQLPQPPAANK